MLDWLHSDRGAPLAGAPAIRRLKTYSAQSGYVYHYFYEGYRREGQGTEYVFSVSADRKEYAPVTVRVDADAVTQWNAAHGRDLAPTEQYAVAKLALFQAFDERAEPAQLHSCAVQVRPADLAAILENLGVD